MQIFFCLFFALFSLASANAAETKINIAEAQAKVLALVRESISKLKYDRHFEKHTDSSFLPQTYPSTFYVEAYKALADSPRGPSKFYADYARLLLDILQLAPSEKCEYDKDCRVRIFETEATDRIAKRVLDFESAEIFHRPPKAESYKFTKRKNIRRLRRPVADFFNKFRKEIDAAESRDKTDYPWFTQIWNRMIFLGVSDAVRYHPEYGYMPFNTGWTEYVAFIDYIGAWRHASLFDKFQREVGDDLTKSLRSPLALSRLRGYFIIPYPFELSADDLLLFHPSPYQDTNTVPAGWPFKAQAGDGGVVFLPPQFTIHDEHHLAIWVHGTQTALSKDLSEEQARAIYQWLQNGTRLFNAAIDKLRANYFQMKLSREKGSVATKFIGLGLIDVAHEAILALAHRVDALVGDWCFFSNVYGDEKTRKRDVAAYEEVFGLSEEKALTAVLKEHGQIFKAFVKSTLSPEHFEHLQAWIKSVPKNTGQGYFGHYSIHLDSVDAISLTDILSGRALARCDDIETAQCYAPFDKDQRQTRYLYQFRDLQGPFDARKVRVIQVGY